jgi:hypothetical protein
VTNIFWRAPCIYLNLHIPHLRHLATFFFLRSLAMVCFTSMFTRLLGRRKHRRSVNLSPPPYDPQTNTVVQVEEKQHVITESQLLNPELHFTAHEIEAHLVLKDTRFAAAVVELMVPRLKLGVWKEPVGWGHYSYTLDKVSFS